MNNRIFILAVLALICLAIYLFVTAPPPLEGEQPQGAMIPIQTVFQIAATENAAVRALYTREIVTAGQQVGLQFDEHWRDPEVQAGPLPALFLRETAMSLEKNPVRLGLFLGSDYPISSANAFVGVQMDAFAAIRETRQPQFFYEPDTQLQTAMFPDIAMAEGCVKCHNEHQDSPKQDWQLDDVMGATTWTYPSEMVTFEEAMQIIYALRQGFQDAYSAYLAEVATFENPPMIGEQWARDGYFLPSLEVFMKEVESRVSQQTLQSLLAAAAQPQ